MTPEDLRKAAAFIQPRNHAAESLEWNEAVRLAAGLRAMADAPVNAQHELGELLAVIHGDGGHYAYEHGLRKAVDDAFARLNQLKGAMADAEPVGYWSGTFDRDGHADMFDAPVRLMPGSPLHEIYKNLPLYTTPQRPQWGGLTEDEIWEIAANCLDSVDGRLQFARAIEAALRAKNGDAA